MLFNSYSFLLFFPLVSIIYFWIPRRIQRIWLLAASYFFYMCWDARYVFLLLFSTIVTYVSGLLINKYAGGVWRKSHYISKAAVSVSIVLNLGILFFFKYFDFAIQLINSVLDKLNFSITISIPTFNVLLPVGISLSGYNT